MLRIDLGDGVRANFVVASVSPPEVVRPDQPFSSFILAGPYGNSLYLDEDQIAYIQPEGPQDGVFLHITLDSGTSLDLIRPEIPLC